MKRLLCAAAAAALFVATPAFADPSDDTSFDINASVPAACTIGELGDYDMGELDIVLTAGSGALTLAALGSNGVVRTQDFWVSCNDTNRMSITSANNGKLIRDGAAPTAEEAAEGFTNLISYAVTTTNYLPTPYQQPSLSDGTAWHQNNTRGAIHKQVTMLARVTSLNGQNSTRRPLAGDYSDTLTVTVQIAN